MNLCILALAALIYNQHFIQGPEISKSLKMESPGSGDGEKLSLRSSVKVNVPFFTCMHLMC